MQYSGYFLHIQPIYSTILGRNEIHKYQFWIHIAHLRYRVKILGYRFIELNESVFISLPWLVLSYSFLSVLRYQLYTVFLLRWKYYSNSDTVKQVEYFERTLYRIMVLNYELYSIIGTRIFFHASKDLPAHFRRWYLLPAGNINEVKSYPASTEEQRGAHKFTVHIRYKGLLQWP